ncbi:hypothetical protein SADUNF_Sadunf10G0052000 [Salix dunnii]|uniref:Uncharacterized protein n=1 Tax=Salix dunnii TaxID=1413687 RepID=A0A835JV38_9ROSI|nr:hypothetical protein SADUNF_Sadunf10G0052000 [Salix dunnii]
MSIALRETTTPSSPTTLFLRTFKLCLVDKFIPVSYTSLLFFYPMNYGCCYVSNLNFFLTRSKAASKTILPSNVMTIYRAEYNEARVKCIFSDFLKNPDTEILKRFLPAAIESSEAAIGSQPDVVSVYSVHKLFVFSCSMLQTLKAKAARDNVGGVCVSSYLEMGDDCIKVKLGVSKKSILQSLIVNMSKCFVPTPPEN